RTKCTTVVPSALMVASLIIAQPMTGVAWKDFAPETRSSTSKPGPAAMMVVLSIATPALSEDMHREIHEFVAHEHCQRTPHFAWRKVEFGLASAGRGEFRLGSARMRMKWSTIMKVMLNAKPPSRSTGAELRACGSDRRHELP